MADTPPTTTTAEPTEDQNIEQEEESDEYSDFEVHPLCLI